MAETIWKLYEVIRWGSDHHPAGGNGPDTIVLVRAENPKQAAQIAEQVLWHVPMTGRSPAASTIYELGLDTAVYAPKDATVLRGPYYESAYCKGWKQYSRREDEEPWVEDRHYDKTKDSTGMTFSFIAGTNSWRRKTVSASLTWITLKLLKRLEVLTEAEMEKLRTTNHSGVFVEEDRTQHLLQKLADEVLPQIHAGSWEMLHLRKPTKVLSERANAELLEEEKKDVQEWLKEFVKLCGECTKVGAHRGFTILRMY